uniref:14-3-3 protein gamma-2-like n=2 Tax=Ciona TaxID=7718 RepID=H2XS89_CIOIN|nr:14-3-3 protein gamma-2-like [Ciona intestinalis]BBE49457.1 14-3-3 protein isoform gamma-1 [Ciona robusta]|eukprot:XP_002130813.1 14-3-3 protein gamma-2-like [Ciona intestinalis]
MSSREDMIARAKLSEQAQRYNEMAAAMKVVVEMGSELSNDERNLLSIAYKHTTGARRQSWRAISSVEQKVELESEGRIELVRDYREKIEAELEAICQEIIQLIDSHLLKSAQDKDSQVFYYKMKGDYFRYMCEISSIPEKRKKVVSGANRAYNAANTEAERMSAINPIKLGLALNHSVFLYEIKNSERKAINIAQTAFDDALKKVEELSADAYKDSTLIMQLIRDNLTQWNSPDKVVQELLQDTED